MADCVGKNQPCKPGAVCSVCKSWGATIAEINLSLATLEAARLIRNRQLDDIEEDIKEAKHAYYCRERPIMSDASYDMLEDILKRERPNSPVLKIVGCPLCYQKEE